LPKRVLDTIDRTLPHGPGQRHKAVFAFARQLRGMGYRDAGVCRPLVAAWHRMALEVIRTKPFSSTWMDFLDGFGRIQLPTRDGVLRPLIAQALSGLGSGASSRAKVLAVCEALQRHHGPGKPFALGCEVVATEIIGRSAEAARGLLNRLIGDGLLRRTFRGSRASGKASEWLLVGA
jgi:hypothetical protein